MRKKGEPIRIIVNGDDLSNTHDIIVKSRINNCGTKFVEANNSSLRIDKFIVCHTLSISNKRWIGTTGMSSYIVELVEKEEPIEEPSFTKEQWLKKIKED